MEYARQQITLEGLAGDIESVHARISGMSAQEAISESDHREILEDLRAIGARIFRYSKAIEQCGYAGESYDGLMQMVQKAKTSITYAVSSVNLASSGFAQSPLMKEADKTSSIKKELGKLRDYVDEIVRDPLYYQVIAQANGRD